MHHILLSFVDIDKSADGFFVNICRRTPCGVRGLKSSVSSSSIVQARRTPHGVRGLKSLPPRTRGKRGVLHPAESV